MRLKGIKKEETLQGIIAAIGKGFRKNGYAGIGVDGLAKIAEVTSGAFYNHFGSKEEAFKVSLEKGLDEVLSTIPEFQKKYKSDWAKHFAEYYLGKNHQEDLECGCAMASLTTEVVRFNDHIHQIYETKMQLIAGLIANSISDLDAQVRFQRAWSFLGILTGGLNIIRALDNDKLKNDVSKQMIDSALKILNEV